MLDANVDVSAVVVLQYVLACDFVQQSKLPTVSQKHH